MLMEVNYLEQRKVTKHQQIKNKNLSSDYPITSNIIPPRYLQLYVLIMPRTRFRLNPNSRVA